jgi:hypothetical protein
MGLDYREKGLVSRGKNGTVSLFEMDGSGHGGPSKNRITKMPHLNGKL